MCGEIEQKWPQFEEAFWQFEPQKMVLLSPDRIEFLGNDERIVRNMQKILSVPKNAQFILDIAEDHGSFANFIAQWPTENIVELYKQMKKKGSRLGGMTGPRMLRNMGKDCFLLTHDVIVAIKIHGKLEVAENPSSQKDLVAIQDLFNQWHQQTSLPYCHLSRICACSVGENYQLTESK